MYLYLSHSFWLFVWRKFYLLYLPSPAVPFFVTRFGCLAQVLPVYVHSFYCCTFHLCLLTCCFLASQDVRSVTGKLSASGEVLIRLERAAMIHFGVPSFGVHLNGYVRATGECVCVCVSSH